VVLVGFKPYLKDQLASFSALTLLVWSYDLKNRPGYDLYNVFGGTLNLAQSINTSLCFHGLTVTPDSTYPDSRVV